MSLTVNSGSNNGGDFQPVSAGLHLARCYQVIDLGHQTVPKYKSEGFSVVPKVRITWEICDEMMSDGRPFSISKEYTASLGEQARLRKDLWAWRGRDFTPAELNGFSLENVLGKPCQLLIDHTEKNGKTYANINSIVPVKKTEEVPELVNAMVKFDIQEFDHAIFESLTSYVQKKILMSKELEDNGIPQNKISVAEPEPEIDSDEVPF
jgi:hypothetical protein